MRKLIPKAKLNGLSALRVQLRNLQTVYTVKPDTRVLEQEKQACFLTKSLCRIGIPAHLHDHVNLNQSHRDELISSFKKSIIQTNWFHVDDDGSFDPKMKRALKEHISFKVMLNFLRIIWSNDVASKAGLLDRCSSWRPAVVAPWERLGHALQVSGKLGQLLCGRELLPAFASREEVEATRREPLDWDDVISPVFELPYSKSNFVAERGFHDGAPYSCPQTLLIDSLTWWKSHLKTGQAIFFSFAQALAFALSKGYKIGQDLPAPIPIQAVSFDGDSFFFVCYQLNTLNFDSSASDIKNIAWVESNHKLYERVTGNVSESEDYMDFGKKRVSLEGFNRNAAELFLTFVLNPYDRDV